MINLATFQRRWLLGDSHMVITSSTCLHTSVQCDRRPSVTVLAHLFRRQVLMVIISPYGDDEPLNQQVAGVRALPA